MAPIFWSLAFTWWGARKGGEGGREGAVIDGRWDETSNEEEAYLMRDVVSREFVKHLSSQPAYDALSRLSSTAGAVLRLNGQDGVQTTIGHVASVAEEDRGQEGLEQRNMRNDNACVNSRDICIGMHSKDFWGVHKREAIDAVQVLLYGLEDRDAIALVVAEGWLEHPLIEPVLHGECSVTESVIIYTPSPAPSLFPIHCHTR